MKNNFLKFVLIISLFLINGLIVNAQSTIVVSSGGNLQAALVTAKCGDTVVLEAGASFVVPSRGSYFLLPAKTGCSNTDADYITVKSSRSNLLPDGEVGVNDRINMAKIVALGSGGAISTENNTKYWKFVGIEITNISNGSSDEHVGTLIELGNYQTGVQHLHFDKMYVHPQEDGTTDYTRTATRGFGVNNVLDFELTNSRVSGFMGHYQHDPLDYIDSEAIASNSGDGYRIVNNFLQGHFNTIFLGGGGTDTLNTGVVQASPSATLTSATLSTVANLNVGDYVSFPQSVGSNANGRVLTISGNSITFTSLDKFDRNCECRVQASAPQSGTVARWNGVIVRQAIVTGNTFDVDTANAQWEFNNYGRRMPKGFLEIKHCDTCLFEGNVFQGWPSTIALNAVNQNGDSPWTTIKNFTFRKNWIKNFNTGLTIAMGNPNGTALWHMTAEGTNIVIEDNLFTHNNSLPDDYGATRVAIWGFGNGVRISHNTVINNGTISPNTYMFASNGPITGFVFQDNIVFNNWYGMNCGLGSFSICYPNWIERKNIVVNNSNDINAGIQPIYPNSFIVSSIADVGFVDAVNGNYKLSDNSPYKGQASDGRDPGADIDALNAALGEASTPTPTPSPTPVPSPTPSPAPSPTPVSCTMTVPVEITMNRRSTGVITIYLNNLTGPAAVSLLSSSGQITATPTSSVFTGTSVSAQFTITTKQNSGWVQFTSSCGPTQTMTVMVR